MAINKRLIHFKKKENFDSEVANENILNNSIVFIQDNKSIYTHNTTYSFINWSYIESPFLGTSLVSQAGDICLYDNSQGIIQLITLDNFINKLSNKESYTPIGIVTVPGYHNVYGDNSCGIISLKSMNCSDPINGSVIDDSQLYWGPQVNISLSEYNKVHVYAADGSITTNNFGYLSKDGIYNSESLHIPDPYASDGTRNPDYYNTTATSYSQYNSTSDFKGKENTITILQKRGEKDYSTWIPTLDLSTDYPAASCCDMYSTLGIGQGNWYLPACGELCYIMAKWSIINNSLRELNNYYNTTISVPLVDENGYWTSTENAAKNARYVHMNNGVGYSNKDTKYSVRAFSRIII